jgi:hypothetical protein
MHADAAESGEFKTLVQHRSDQEMLGAGSTTGLADQRGEESNFLNMMRKQILVASNELQYS